MRSNERGSISVAAMAWLGLAGVCALGLLRVGDAAVDRAQAATAADAAALAAAAAGDDAAKRAAEQNDAVLVSIERRGEWVQVRVRVDQAHAEAAAERFRID